MAGTVDRLYAELEDRDDPATWLVLADALLEAGDRRGELAQLHHAAAEGDRAARRRAEALQRELLAHLVGCSVPDEVALDWRYGHLVGARFPSQVSAAARAGALQELLGHPGNRFLRTLFLDGPPGELAEGLFRDTLAPLRAAGVRAPASLHTLQLGEGYDENPSWWVYGYFEECRLVDDLGALWEVFPDLRTLRIDLGAAWLQLGAIRAEQLRDFEWVTPCLRPEGLAPLAAAHWPALERLVLWTGGEVLVNTEDDLEEGMEVTGELSADEILEQPEQFDVLFEALDALPRLQTFGVVNYCGRWSELAVRAAGRPFWERLTALDLSHGRLDDDEVPALAAACRAAPGLRQLKIEGLVASGTAVAALRRALPEVALVGTWVAGPPLQQFYYVVTQE